MILRQMKINWMKMQQMKITKNTDAENDDTANDTTANSASNQYESGDGSENAYGSQSGADKRTDAQNSKTRLHIPPVILKNLTLCDFSDCTYSHHSLYQKAKKYFVGSKTCKKGEKRPLQQGSNNDKQPHLQRTGTSFKKQDR